MPWHGESIQLLLSCPGCFKCVFGVHTACTRGLDDARYVVGLELKKFVG